MTTRGEYLNTQSKNTRSHAVQGVHPSGMIPRYALSGNTARQVAGCCMKCMSDDSPPDSPVLRVNCLILLSQWELTGVGQQGGCLVTHPQAIPLGKTWQAPRQEASEAPATSNSYTS